MFGPDGLQVPETNRDSLNRPVRLDNSRMNFTSGTSSPEVFIFDSVDGFIKSKTGPRIAYNAISDTRTSKLSTERERVTTATIDAINRKRSETP